MTTINKEEIQKFSNLADEWWDVNGKFKPLHMFNPVRIEFYEDNIKSQQNAAKKLAKGFDKYESYIKKINSLESQDNIVLKEVNKPFDNINSNICNHISL